ncbi:hypothetical protein BSFA1_83490 (plasmid) [Burkholderia sp. SFA1]|nr:metal-dependent phosphohydrolase [Burkholderia sp. YI23]BBQ03221.1 hypothetical protein BSFA1_83490 [Burkholderia sp. SFA1]
MGKRKSVTFDPELLYVAAKFHDIGSTPAYRESALRFEVDGTNATRDFSAHCARTKPGIPEQVHGEMALAQAGAGMDVARRGSDDVQFQSLTLAVETGCSGSPS